METFKANLEEGIASTNPGVDADYVTIVSLELTNGRRRLSAGEGGVVLDVEFTITYPDVPKELEAEFKDAESGKMEAAVESGTMVEGIKESDDMDLIPATSQIDNFEVKEQEDEGRDFDDFQTWRIGLSMAEIAIISGSFLCCGLIGCVASVVSFMKERKDSRLKLHEIEGVGKDSSVLGMTDNPARGVV